MNLKRAFGVAAWVTAVFLSCGCTSSETPNVKDGAVKMFLVAPAQRDGVGVGPMTCLQVKDAASPDAAFQLFYSPIKGFDYVPGYVYELKVRVTERERVPADASRYEYELIEIVSKTAAGLSIDHTAWKLKTYISVSETMEPVLESSEAWLRISDGRVSGHAGANTFFGAVKVEGTSLEFSASGSTMMMGTPELMAQESQFMKWLEATADYQIVGNELRFRTAEQKVVLVFVPRVDVSLVSPEWNAVGINNGRGGVQSLVAGTSVYMMFGDDGRVLGSSGCNGFSGPYERTGNFIKIGPLASTRMRCAEPDGIMEQEAAFLMALEKTQSFSIDGAVLELRDEGGALQVKFTMEGK